MSPTMRPGADGLYHASTPLPGTVPAPVYLPGCWLAHHGRFEGVMPSCEGRLVKIHLIPQQKLKRELGATLGREMAKDPRTFVYGCGGITGGPGGHHGAFDSSRRLRVPWAEIPDELKELCREWEKQQVWRGAYAWLELTYRRRAVPMAHRGGYGGDGG